MGLSFHMLFTAAGLYRIDVANLKVYELILIGSAMEISIFIFEVPTGIVADLKSRKLSVIIGLFVMSIGMFIEGMTVIFLLIFLAQFIWGFGYTFISGALDAWISDETKNENIEKVMIQAAQGYQLASVLGIVLAAVIGLKDIRVALFVAGGLSLLLGVFLIFFMKETREREFIKKGHFYKRYYGQLIDGFSHIKKHRVLRIMFFIMLFYGLYSEGIDRTYEVFILDGLDFRSVIDLAPIWILAIVNASIAIFSYIMLNVVKKYLKKGHHIYIWAFNFTLMMILGIIGFAYLPNIYFALSGFIFFSISRGGTYPLLNAILVNNTPSKVKATVLSSFGQLDAIGQLLSGGLMVVLALWFKVSELYLVTALLLVVPLVLFTRLKNNHINDSKLLEVNG
jgi:DHA3 family tetracycline resistance protein-like MFS transporter